MCNVKYKLYCYKAEVGGMKHWTSSKLFENYFFSVKDPVKRMKN